MISELDNKKDIALKILTDVLNINPINVTRFQNGYCHSVYCVQTNGDKYVLRVTNEDNKKYYYGSLKWLSELGKLNIPVPKVLNHGKYEDMFFTLISFINGNDIADLYHTLSDSQKHDIARELTLIQKKVSCLPSLGLYGYPYSENGDSFKTWVEYLQSLVNRSFERIKQNGIFDVNVCDTVISIMNGFNEYFLTLPPIAFLDDISTKNVLIYDGKLSGIVDVDEICFGDPLLVIGLTNMALLKMEADTKYIDYWLDEFNANEIQRKSVVFYTLLSCVDFMSEQGMKFGNGNIVSVNPKDTELLKFTYNKLLEDLKQ